jgi:hypothetical protein
MRKTIKSLEFSVRGMVIAEDYSRCPYLGIKMSLPQGGGSTKVVNIDTGLEGILDAMEKLRLTSLIGREVVINGEILKNLGTIIYDITIVGGLKNTKEDKVREETINMEPKKIREEEIDWKLKSKEFYLQGMLEFVVLLILSRVTSKFIAKGYIEESLDLKSGHNDNIMTALDRLVNKGFAKRHSLLPYRKKFQSAHDEAIVFQNFDFLKSCGILPADCKRYSVNELAHEAKAHTPPEIKTKLNWLDDVVADGEKKLQEFIESSTVGRIALLGHPTQSVFCITDAGLARLEQREKQIVEISKD